jgi:type IV pilus assembly protein PilV
MRRAATGASPAKPRGFTVIEVMMALAVLTLGAMTVVSIQKATLIANTNARNLATATEIAQTWIERARLDALAWTNAGGIPNIGNTVWLQGATNANGWFTPATTFNGNPQPAGTPVADVTGADLWNANDPLAPAFCTQMRLTGYGLQNPNLWSLARLVRVEVRVYWDKRGAAINCATPLPAATLPSSYGSVYVVSGVLENNAPF